MQEYFKKAPDDLNELVLNLLKELRPSKPKDSYEYFTKLNKDEQIMAAVVFKATDIVKTVKSFIDTLEEVDSYIDSFEDMFDEPFPTTSKDKIYNAIISDIVKVGGLGFDIKVKSLESK